MNLTDATKIMKAARQVFSYKSNNKMFATTRMTDPSPVGKKDMGQVTADMESVHARLTEEGQLEQAQELQKRINRNKKVLDGKTKKLSKKNPGDGAPAARGRTMVKRSKQGREQVGNCGDQVDSAIYLAVKDFKVPIQQLWRVDIDDPGDHVFCVWAPQGKPTWASVAEMKNVTTGAIVIDPWMNFACNDVEYEAQATAKLKQWLAIGKRICWDGKDGETPGWYEPGVDYTKVFLECELLYQRGDKD
jgi:hypothetical protein